MEVDKKRKRDVDCPRITYDTSTKVFDRLFKEESLEEMKNVVRKKLGLSSSLPVHLSQVRHGKPIVLEDDDDFDAFYASVHSTAVAKIMVYLGDDQPSRASPDAGFTGGSMQSLGSPTIHHAAAEGLSPSKKRKVTFVSSQPVGDNVEEPGQSLPNFEPPPEVPATLDEISADAEGAHETSDKTKTGNVSIGPPKETRKKKNRMEVVIVGRESNAALSEPISATSNSTIAVQPAKEQDPKPSASTSAVQAISSDSKGKTMKSATLRKTLTKKSRKKEAPVEAPEPTEEEQAMYNATKAAIDAILGPKEAPVEAPEANEEDMALYSATKAAVDAILGPKEAPVEAPEANEEDMALYSATKAAVDAILGKLLDTPPNNTSTITEPFDTAPKCPICERSPSHVRSRCPIIRSGTVAMRRRMAELQRETPDDNNEERKNLIEELQRIIDKRTKSNQTRREKKLSNAILSKADKSVISPTLAADSSSVIEPPKTSQTVKPAKAPIQELETLEDESSRPRGRIRHPEEEGEDEASPFMPSIMPPPIRSASELLNEDGSSRPEELQGDTSFREVNDLGSSIEVDRTGDAAVNDAHALDVAPKPSENGRKTALDEAPQSDLIETQPAFPQSPIASIEEDNHPIQSTPKAGVAGRTESQRISSILSRRYSGSTTNAFNAASRKVNGISKNYKSTKKTGSLLRIINPAIKPASKQTHQQAARAGEEGEEADKEGPKEATPKTRTKTQFPVNRKTRSIVQDVPESGPSNTERSVASWAVLEGNSLANGSPGMLDELLYSSDIPGPAQRPVSPTVVNGVSNVLDPLFLHSESQQSFPYSQYPNEAPGSEDEEDEVHAFVVKPQTTTKKSSKFRSLTEITSRPTLFTPTIPPTQNNGSTEEVVNLFGRVNKGEEDESEEDSDTESDSDAGAKAKTSHIPLSRRAGALLSKR